MKTKNHKMKFRGAGVCSLFALMTQAAPGASFVMLNDPALSSGFEQRWNQSAIWQYVSGVDDGTAGIPDGSDTFTIDRNTGGFPAGNTDLSNEGMPTHSIAAITATGAPGTDIVLKVVDLTIGDLTVLASASEFLILAERDKSLTINGVISGAGDLVLTRAGGFSDGVTPDEVISLTGSSLNTISGSITLSNTNGGGQPSFFVADKVGAFGQASTLTLAGVVGSGATSLRFTTNTIGVGGAIDDDATTVFIGVNGLLDVDAGVNEFIGSGKLTVDGNPIADGIYTNSETWITGAGTITVGVPEPSSFAFAVLGLLGLIRRKR